MRPCATACADTSSVPAMAPRCVGLTCVQSPTDGLLSRTFARIAAATAGERSQTSPATTGVPPCTRRSVPPASASWPGAAAPPSETPRIVPPFSARLSATRSTPSVSVSVDFAV